MSEADISDADFDESLIAAAFRLAAVQGWRKVSVAAAAGDAGLPLDRTRERFSGRQALLLRFGRLADQAALAEAPSEGTVRDQLFDLIMRRIDYLQIHRAGVLSLLHALPAHPDTALLLGCATRRSMAWMLSAAGVSTGGIVGHLRVSALLGVWIWTLRAWERDEDLDLPATMAALDTALARVEGLASRLHRPGSGRKVAATPEPEADEPFSPHAEPAG